MKPITEEEIQAGRDAIIEHCSAPADALVVIHRLENERNILRDAIRVYGQHTYECDSHSAVGGHWHDCDCGWDKCEFNHNDCCPGA